MYSSVSYTASQNVENITLTGNTNIYAAGNNSDNVLVGNSGHNRLNAGSGNDTVYGGEGSDHIGGGEGNDVLYGEKGNDHIHGDKGNDVLDGGEGKDTMRGQAGDDVYYVDNAADTVIEERGQGTDTVYSSVSYTASQNVENVTLTGSANIYTAGNNADNVLVGNSGHNRLNAGRGNDTVYGGEGSDQIGGGDGNDVLYGEKGNDHIFGDNGNDVLDGGEGKDTMRGQAGDDVYYVDNAADTVIEERGQGTDTIYSSVSYTASQNVENITLTGNANIYAAGNNSDNVLVGNSGHNRLNAGSGNDTVYGGEGSDHIGGGEGNDVLYGEKGNDHIHGDKGNDVLDGGAGNDLLSGQAGNDTYVFAKGYGNDVVRDTEGTNTVRFDGIAAGDVTVSENNGSWVITLKETGDTLTIENQTADASAAVTRFEFSDGLLSNVELAMAAGLLKPQGNVINGTENDDRLEGTEKDEALNGLGGNDTLRGAKGVDVADGGDGDDALIAVGDLTSGSKSANKAYDTVLGQSLAGLKGTDYAEVTAGDVFRGGAGNDTLYVFGTTDLSKAVLDSIEKIDMPSDVTLAADQLSGVSVSGDSVGTLRVKEESAEKVVVLGDQQLNGVKQLDIGKNVVIEVKNLAALNGVEIISGNGTLRFTEPTALTADHSVAGKVKVVNADGSSAIGSAEVLDRIISASDDTAVRGEINDLPYKDLLSDGVAKGNNPVTILDGSDGNDYIEGGSTHDALDGVNGDDVLVGKDGNDIFVINGTGKKTIIDGGSNQDTDTIVLSNANQGAEIDLSQFKGSIGTDTTIQIGASDSHGVAGSAGDKTNLMLIIDRSGSMSWDNRMENAKDAVIKLIEKYNQLGDIAIRVIGFDGYSYVEFNGVNAWMNKVDAVNAINSLSAWGGTDYYVALDAAETAFVSGRGKVFHEGGNNFSMFLSDGEPNSYLNMIRQTQWENFVINHKIVSHAIGFGGIYNTAALEPIAFDGTAVADTSAADRTPGQISPILEGDIDKLVTTVSGTAKTDFIENVAGTAFDDKITGNSLDNVIKAGAGDDTVKGLDGNDTLDGGKGDDRLEGGAGNDVYRFGTGDGQDTVVDTQGSNRVKFDGINKADVSVNSVQEADGSESWVITVTATGDTLTVKNQTADASAAVTGFEFADGTLSNADLAQLIGAPSAEPVAALALSFGSTNIVAASAENKVVVHGHNIPVKTAADNSASDGLLDSGAGSLDSALNSILPASGASFGAGLADTAAYAAETAQFQADDNAQGVTAVI
ncbi:calcium-binding protein [Neisseria sp. CCUG12390]|uniref:calcium-binding protein n=1 Tax=Neisseria sp. CCUG12390 TaxID=3392035 RepID=UPI003A10015A